MQQRTLRVLVAIAILAVAAAYLSWPSNDYISLGPIQHDIKIREGLDLQGGVQVRLEADPPAGVPVTSDTMQAARDIIEKRINALGVAEPLIQMQGDRRIIVELPGLQNVDEAIKTFQGTGLLEFIDAGSTPLPIDAVVTTSLGGPSSVTSGTTSSTEPGASTQPTGTAGITDTVAITDTSSIIGTAGTSTNPSGPVYRTVVTGAQLNSSGVNVGYDQFGKPEVLFEFNSEGAREFGTFTTQNVGKYLCILVDKRVISCPVIQSPITGGSGRITGNFTLNEARNLVIQLKYGALPIPLKIVESRSVGPTLGQDSINYSLRAGMIGLLLVMLFMALYYRLPGLIADLALVLYALLVLSIFKLAGVVLTLAGIAGFILSIGMAVDANILIFERMREELRAGRSLAAALDAGFSRAWSSIRDSNISTLITCVILYFFGDAFGASIIKGFAVTLAIGVLVSMFTAIVVTRTFLQTVQILASRNQGVAALVNRFW